MNPSAVAIPALPDEMRAAFEWLRRDGDRVFGSRRIEIVPLTCSVRESSVVARARVTLHTGVRHIFVKVLRPRQDTDAARADTRARLQRDYLITRHVAEAMRVTGELRCVEPIAMNDALLCIVTREARGVPLDQFTARAAAWPVSETELNALETALSRVGRWVATFQQVAPRDSLGTISLDDVREYLDIRLKRLMAISRARFEQDDRHGVLAYFDRLASDVSSADLEDAPVHGDITPSNVVIADDGITVLDFAMASRGSRYLDIARLHTQLDFYRAKPQYRPAVIERLQRAALRGFDPALSVDQPLFEIYRLQHVTCHFLSHARQPGPFPVSLYSRHQCRLHRRWLRTRARDGVPASVRIASIATQ